MTLKGPDGQIANLFISGSQTVWVKASIVSLGYMISYMGFLQMTLGWYLTTMNSQGNSLAYGSSTGDLEIDLTWQWKVKMAKFYLDLQHIEFAQMMWKLTLNDLDMSEWPNCNFAHRWGPNRSRWNFLVCYSHIISMISTDYRDNHLEYIWTSVNGPDD